MPSSPVNLQKSIGRPNHVFATAHKSQQLHPHRRLWRLQRVISKFYRASHFKWIVGIRATEHAIDRLVKLAPENLSLVLRWHRVIPLETGHAMSLWRNSKWPSMTK
jgi:hypothetical protein